VTTAAILRVPQFSIRFLPVWRRNLLVWKKLAIASILGNIADPLLYMLALGYGIGSLIGDVGGMSYIAFIGTGYDPDRAALLVQVASRYDLKVWGPGWERWREKLSWSGRSVEGRDFAAVCSSSQITLGINPSRAQGGVSYTSDRTWMVMLAGGFYLAQRTPGVAAMLNENEHCGFYDDPTSCVEQCGRYLGAPAEREEIRIRGERFVRAHHTYDQRVPNILEDRPFTNPLAAA